MPASYPTSVKSFSAKVNGDLIDVSHVKDLEAEVVAVETALVNGLPVTHGGSGRLTATTAYSVIAAGTTATGAQQSIAPSTSGFVLTDNGTGVLPSFQAAAVATPALGIAEGRLTLTSATPVTTADVSAATTAYYTPYIGNSIVLFDGSATWTKYTFTEITISLVGLTASRPYDVFAYNSGGTVTIETLVWTNATTRATALAYQNGVLVKSGATTRRYLGTIYINATGGQTDDTVRQRFVWNYYNRVDRQWNRQETTTGWAYTTAVVRQANGSATNQVEMVCGVLEDTVDVTCIGGSYQTGANVKRWVGIGEDATTAGVSTGQVSGAGSGGTEKLECVARLVKIPSSVGFHYYAWLEWSTASGSTTWLGNDTGDTCGRLGMVGRVRG